jgi:hypothetical protein
LTPAGRKETDVAYTEKITWRGSSFQAPGVRVGVMEHDELAKKVFP